MGNPGTLMSPPVRAKFFICHGARLRIDMLAGVVLSEIANDYSVALAQAREDLDTIWTLDSGVDFAFFDMVLRIHQKHSRLACTLIDRLQRKGEGIRVILHPQRNIGIHS